MLDRGRDRSRDEVKPCLLRSRNTAIIQLAWETRTERERERWQKCWGEGGRKGLKYCMHCSLVDGGRG